MKHILPGITALLLIAAAATCQAADFTLREQLGHRWTNERVMFQLTPAQATRAAKKPALVGPGDKEIPYQLMAAADQNSTQIFFQTDLAPFEHRTYRFSGRPATIKTDLRIQESESELRIENEWVGLAIRKSLERGQGPIAGVRLRSGIWTGGSSLVKASRVKGYTARVTARGPVFVEVHCRVDFAGGGHWSLRFRIERGEPVVLVEESFDAPGEGAFRVNLGSETFRPTHLFYRSGEGGNLGKVSTQAIGSDQVFVLEPWLHWWEAERQGNWFALYHEAAPHPDMLMIGLLRPGAWKDPEWSGKAPHVELKVPAQAEDGLVTVSFPLGGGKRVWMLGTPDKAQSVGVLSEKNLKISPLPQQYLIKHGDFPLDVVKDYVLEWEGDHDTYPRLFFEQQEWETVRGSLQTNPAELKRWESQQPIDKYNIGGPLREYFASESAQLGDNIIKTASKWLDVVVNDDLLLQHGRVTLGFAPHNQAVLLLPTLNLTDAALGIESLAPELRRQFLAKLALLAYVVNSDDYWSPARGFSANPNMTTTVAQYQVTLAALIPSHPMAKQWASRGLDTLLGQLREWSDEDGGWLEAPHYAVVAYDHMLGAFIMASRAGFANHLYDERVRKVAGWLARISTPRDPHTGGFRHLPPIGNTYYGESTGIFCIVAGLWKERDPQFAAHMQWMCEEHGSPGLGLGWSFPTMAGYKDLLKAHGVAAQKPDYGSAWFEKTGVVLRSGIGSDRETYLHLIAGSNHEHYDYDSGSIVLWGKGRVLADDWGYIGRHDRKYHNLVSSLVARGTMRITDFSTQAAFDYVSGQKVAWQRQIGFVKDEDPLGPNFFLIRDTHHLDIQAEWRLWLTVGPAADQKADPVQLHARGATVSGADDVDFDLFFYQPGQIDLKTETASQDMTVGNRDGKVGPMTLTQTALIASVQDRVSVTLLVFPRLKSEPSPKVTWHAGGRIVEVVTETGSDFVFMASQTKSDGREEFSTADKKLSFRGAAGSIRVRGQRVTLSLGTAGTIRLGEETFTAGTAATRSVPRSE
jgi:hypothetical protein